MNLNNIKAPQYGEVKVNDTVEGMDVSLFKNNVKKNEKKVLIFIMIYYK